MAVGRLVDESAGFNGPHVVGIVDIGFGAGRHPPRALHDRDMPGCTVEVGAAALTRPEGDPDYVEPGLTGIAEDGHRPRALGGHEVCRVSDEEPFVVRRHDLARGSVGREQQAAGHAAGPHDQSYHGFLIPIFEWPAIRHGATIFPAQHRKSERRRQTMLRPSKALLRRWLVQI